MTHALDVARDPVHHTSRVAASRFRPLNYEEDVELDTTGLFCGVHLEDLAAAAGIVT